MKRRLLYSQLASCSSCMCRKAHRFTNKSLLALSICTSTKASSPPQEGSAFLPTRRLLSIAGPDSQRYLQGATTNNITTNDGRGLYAAFLNAQGRLLHDVFIYPHVESQGRYKGHPAWLVEVDAREVDALARRILRYRLRNQFEVRVLSETELVVWAVWDEAESFLTNQQIHADPFVSDTSVGAIAFRDNRVPGIGLRLLLPGGVKPRVGVESDERSYRARRYLNGVPEGQEELVKEVALPQESNIDLMGGVDYHKGCYIGQELTIRTHHTGVIRKRVLPVRVYGDDEAEPSSLIYDDESALAAEEIPRETSIARFGRSGKSAGKWLGGVGNIGLALCRLGTMTSMTVQEDPTTYQAGDEFKMEWRVDGGTRTRMLKVKAFLPEWHLARQAALRPHEGLQQTR